MRYTTVRVREGMACSLEGGGFDLKGCFVAFVEVWSLEGSEAGRGRGG